MYNIFYYRICYTKKLGVRIILPFSQRNGKLPFSWWKQGNYPVTLIYAWAYGSGQDEQITWDKQIALEEEWGSWSDMVKYAAGGPSIS